MSLPCRQQVTFHLVTHTWDIPINDFTLSNYTAFFLIKFEFLIIFYLSFV